MEDAALRSALLAWYDAHRRDLPWRGSRDPYAVWVSEAMLQQTRVETVRPYYARWMARFPDVAALAAASEEEALALWSGLGYYARARALHRAARIVVAEHGGRLPADPTALGRLPGFGPYTVGAVASIAFGLPLPAVDGNVVRVLARLEGVHGDVKQPALRRTLAARATALVDPARPGDWNQALMDLGATVCTPRAPACGTCPWSSGCRARSEGAAEQIPPPARKAAPKVERPRFAVVVRDGRVLLRAPAREGLLAGTWLLPGGAAGSVADLEAAVRMQTGVAVQVTSNARRVRHLFTHRTWEMAVHAAALSEDAPLAAGAEWVPVAELGAQRPLSVAMRRALQTAGAL